MREAQKQARVRIASAAIAYLLVHAGDPCYKKSFFVPPKNANKTEASEAFKNKWQTDFLNRLVEDGVIERTSVQGQMAYIGNQKGLQRIINDLHDGDGSILSGYLWPNTKTDISEAPTRENLIETIEESPEQTTQFDEEFANLLKRFFGMVLENQNVLHENTAELPKKIGSYNKRLELIESRMGEIVRNVQANQSVIKPAMENVNKLAEGISKLEELIEVMKRQEARTQALHDSVDELVGIYKKDQNDKIGNLLNKLEIHSKESEQLRDMIFEEMVNK